MHTLIKFSCLAVLFSVQFATAAISSSQLPYYPSDFYNAVDTGLENDELKKQLFAILSSAHISRAGQHDTLATSCSGPETCTRHTTLGYGPARRLLFGQLHLAQSPDGYSIRDVYCERTITQADFRSSPPGPGQIPDPAVMNTEHTWPQSRFSSSFDKEMQKSDLHILYPVVTKANSSRGNIEFGEVVTVISSPCPASARGYSADGGRKVYFEVPDSHKGNVARAIFYFSVRYRLRIQPAEEVSLRAWHRSDPADNEELTRNSAIFTQQKVRNPFIDHPELVELISDF